MGAWKQGRDQGACGKTAGKRDQRCFAERVDSPLAVLAAMAVWTVVVSVAYSRDWGRNWQFAAIDLAVTLICMAGSVLAYPLDRIQDGWALQRKFLFG